MNRKPIPCLMVILFLIFIGLGTTSVSKGSNNQSSDLGQGTCLPVLTAPDSVRPSHHNAVDDNALFDRIYDLDLTSTLTTPITSTVFYTITDLGSRVIPYAINNVGQVVGWMDSVNPDPERKHAFVWQAGVIQDLGNLGCPGDDTLAYDINDAGQVVGESCMRAFLWQDGVMHDLGELGDLEGSIGAAFGINESGQVVGFSDRYFFDGDFYYYLGEHAFVWQDGAMIDLNPPGDFLLVEAHGINDNGQVVGGSGINHYGWPADRRALLWENGMMYDLGTLGGPEAYAYEINDAGQIIGDSSLPDGSARAFLWQDGVMQDIGALEGGGSHGSSINEAGQVVGDGGTPGFLWQDDNHNGEPEQGEMHDLNDFIPTNSGWYLAGGADINDAGQIVGTGGYLGADHGFLLTPLLHLEVTQAIQDERNSVPLIENKPTIVRAYVDCGPNCTSQPGVTGVLHGYGPSGELPGSPLQPVNGPITAHHEDWRIQRGEWNKTLNFILPKEWRTGIVTLEADINMAGRMVKSTQAVTFQAARIPDIVYVPVQYETMAPTPRIAYGSQWAQRVWPTSNINYTEWPTFTWIPNPTCETTECLEQDLLLQLTLRYFLGYLQGQTEDYIYGWLPDGSLLGDLDGSSDPAWFGGVGRAAFGKDDPAQGPLIFAHEIAHLMGRHHTKATNDPSPCADLPDDPLYPSDWPYPTAGIQEWGLDSWGLVLKNPSRTDDYMSYCGELALGNVWTSPFTFKRVYEQTLKAGSPASTGQAPSVTQPYLIASGLVYTDDVATLDPMWVISSSMAPENQITGTEYCLEAQNAYGTPLSSHCFDLSFLEYDTREATDVDGFSWMLPYPDDVARIVVKKGPVELAVRSVTANAPEVTVLFPNGGESWSSSGTYTITWSANDDDGDSLVYQVLYSPDGTSWTPAAGPVTQTQIAINAAELAGSSTARIRVMASDAVNTTIDESDGAFMVGRKPPSADILSLESGTTILPGTPLWLQGYAYDLEDGVLGDSMLQWSSDRDGLLGTGSELLVTLSQGWHEITLTAQDSDGNEATATINMYVGYRVHLPLAVKNR